MKVGYLILFKASLMQASATFNAGFVGAGNLQYNSTSTLINAVGTTSLNGVSMSISTFPKLITLVNSLDIASFGTTGNITIDLTSFGFTTAPLIFLTITNDPNTGFINLSTSGITATSVTVNARVGSALVGARTVNFVLNAIGY